MAKKPAPTKSLKEAMTAAGMPNAAQSTNDLFAGFGITAVRIGRTSYAVTPKAKAKPRPPSK